jgi:hypothetical protein
MHTLCVHCNIYENSEVGQSICVFFQVVASLPWTWPLFRPLSCKSLHRTMIMKWNAAPLRGMRRLRQTMKQ